MTVPTITVAIVEDDPETAEFLAVLLGDMGLSPLLCPPNATAVSVISQAQPSLIVLDYQLVDVMGADILRELRANPTTGTIPAIFFTANIQTLRHDLPNYQELGADLVEKPNIDKLEQAIRNILPL